MLPPKELNPSDPFEEMPAHSSGAQHLQVEMSLQDRVIELEARNLYLQLLVAGLLEKNEKLRREIDQHKAGSAQ
jgi:hypothetical protein